jgi:hypothetical protein
MSTTTWEYKVVPLPRDVAVMRKMFAAPDPAATAAGYVEQIINQYAQQGWEFVGISEMSVTERPGCLAALFGGKATLTFYNLLTFRKVKE